MLLLLLETFLCIIAYKGVFLQLQYLLFRILPLFCHSYYSLDSILPFYYMHVLHVPF